MEDLSLHILDIVENSIRSKADLIEISVIDDKNLNIRTLRITDNGTGMDPELCAQAGDPFVTTKPGKRIGLGLALLSQAAKEADGELHITSEPARGTTVKASFRTDHPDCKPVGDVGASLQILIRANPDIAFIYEYKNGRESTRLDTREFR